MNKMFHPLAVSLLVLIALPLAWAQEKYTKPRANEVVVVVKFQIDPPIDNQFFSHYATMSVPGLKVTQDKEKRGEYRPTNPVFSSNPSLGLAGYRFDGIVGDMGALTAVTMPIPKNHIIPLEWLQVDLQANPALFFDIDFSRQIVIPEGVNYVYLGTITFSRSGDYFKIGDFVLTDEFDIAKAWVTKSYSPDASLVRVNLQNLLLPKKN